jgi:hypothetical protein
MAYDAEPGGDPRGPICPKCAYPILVSQTSTRMYFADDPYGHQGRSGQPWHSACAQPHWDKISSILEHLQAWNR